MNDHRSRDEEISRTSSGQCWNRCCRRAREWDGPLSGPDGIRFRVRTGVPWRDVPVEYGPWSRVYDLFRRWQRNGTWQRILNRLQSLADARGAIVWDLSIDSTVCRAHQHAAGAHKRGDPVATRYDKLAGRYEATVLVAASMNGCDQLNQGRRTDVRGVVEVQVLMACSTNWPQARNPRRRYTGSPSADACRTAMPWSRSRAA